MKKISEHSKQYRKENSSFFILEKYNNNIRDSILKTLNIIESEAKNLDISSNEYSNILAEINKNNK